MVSNTSHTGRESPGRAIRAVSIPLLLEVKLNPGLRQPISKKIILKSNPYNNFCSHPDCAWGFGRFFTSFGGRQKYPLSVVLGQNSQPSVLLDSAFPSVLNRRSKHAATSQNTLPSDSKTRTFPQNEEKPKSSYSPRSQDSVMVLGPSVLAQASATQDHQCPL